MSPSTAILPSIGKWRSVGSNGVSAITRRPFVLPINDPKVLLPGKMLGMLPYLIPLTACFELGGVSKLFSFRLTGVLLWSSGGVRFSGILSDSVGSFTTSAMFSWSLLCGWTHALVPVTTYLITDPRLLLWKIVSERLATVLESKVVD